MQAPEQSTSYQHNQKAMFNQRPLKEFKLIRRNANRQIATAFTNITSANWCDSKTKYELVPYTDDLNELKEMYQGVPGIKLYQIEENQYCLVIAECLERIYFNTNEPAIEPEPVVTPVEPEVASVTDVIPASAEPEALKQPAASAEAKQATIMLRGQNYQAFQNITVASFQSKATNYEWQPVMSFAQIKALYETDPKAVLCQESQDIYVLFLSSEDTVYRFATNHQPLKSVLETPLTLDGALTLAHAGNRARAGADANALEVMPVPAFVGSEIVDKVTALEAKYRQARDQYIKTRREADALEVKATLKRQEAQIFHEKMKELGKQIDLIFDKKIKKLEELIDAGKQLKADCYYCTSLEYASIRDKTYRCYICNPETESEKAAAKQAPTTAPVAVLEAVTPESESIPAPTEQDTLERPATPEEQRADEIAKRFAEGWENWNIFDTGHFLKYKRPYTLTKKQVDWLRNVWVKQFKWGESRDKACERRSMNNMGSTYQREFLWQVSIHLNGSGTFEVLVKK